MNDPDFEAQLTEVLVNHPSESAFARLCGLYRVSDPAQRARIRASVPPTFSSWAMPDRYSLAAGDDTPARAECRLRDLLTWDAAFPSDDFRDDLVAMAPLYHSAVWLGLDPVALFDEAAAVAGTPGAATLLREFPRRRPELRSPAAFLLREIPTSHGGVRFVRET